MYPENCSDTVHETMLIFTLSVKYFEKGEFVNCQLNIQEQEWAGKHIQLHFSHDECSVLQKLLKYSIVSYLSPPTILESHTCTKNNWLLLFCLTKIQKINTNFPWTFQLFHRTCTIPLKYYGFPTFQMGPAWFYSLLCTQYIVLHGSNRWRASDCICGIVQNQTGHQYHRIALITHPRSFDGSLLPLAEGPLWERPLAPNVAVA